MTEHLYVLTLFVAAATSVLIFALWAFATFQTARKRTADEEAYRKLAASATQAETQAAASLASLTVDMSSMAERLATIEKTLRSVE